jgi:type IV pilus assembly protein PilA
MSRARQACPDVEGFTLVEIMVVVVVMGILLAIAIPSFLATKGNAYDASAGSNATNVLTTEKAYFVNNGEFIDAGSAHNGAKLDNQLPWGANGVPTVTGTVTAQVGTATAPFAETTGPGGSGSVLLVEDYSTSGRCFYIEDDEAANPSTLGYAESSGGCVPDSKVTFGAPASGSAGANIVPSGTITAGDWYKGF